MPVVPRPARSPRAPRRPAAVWAALLSVLIAAGPALAQTGPDVSRYQHPSGSPIDWGRVAASGQSFAFVKATEGTTVTNAWFADDWSGAAAAGLFRGAYHFARPSSAAGSAAAQAETFAARIGDQRAPGTLPPVLDLESSGGLSRAQLTAWARTFLTRLEALTGRRPIVYTYPSFWQTAMGGTTAFAGYPLWIAHYTRAAGPTHTGWPDWTFWQYTDSSSVDGIRGAVDMNRFRGSAADLARLALAGPPEDPAADPIGLSPGALERPAAPALPDGGTPLPPVAPAVPPGAPGSPAAAAPAASPAPSPGRYTALVPQRVLDTREGLGAARGRVQGALSLRLPDAVPPDAAGVVLSVSAVTPTGAGYVRAAADAGAATTVLNYAPRANATGLAVTRTDAARTVRLSVHGAPSHLVADLVGYYDTTAGAGGHYVAATPSRLVDSRTGVGTARGARTGDLTVTLPAPTAGARAAVLNLSVVDAARDTWVQVGAGSAAPRATALSVAAGRSRTGLVLAAPAPDGTLSLTVHGGPAHVVVDLLGHYDADTATGERYVGTPPARLVDTRSGLGAARGSSSVTLALPPSVPPGSTAVLDVSAVDPTGTGWLRVGPAGTEPVTTALNHSRRESQTGLVLTRADAAGRITLTLHGAPADLVVDLVGHTAR